MQKRKRSLNGIFASESKARNFLERILWPTGPKCPHCRGNDRVYQLRGKSCRPGLYKCSMPRCQRQFTVTVGTIFHRSKVALNLWLQVIFLMCSSKKGMSSLQISRMIGVQYRTAWHMTHRIRSIMKDKAFAGMLKGIVEADEVYLGGKPQRGKRGRGAAKKKIVLGIVERKGRVRAFLVDNVSRKVLMSHIIENVDPDSILCTDEWVSYKSAWKHFRKHLVVKHSCWEYVRGKAHVNTIESFWALLTRGIKGIFHHISRKWLPSYLAEFSFRYNLRRKSELAMLTRVLKGAVIAA